MTFRTAYDTIKTALAAAPAVVAEEIPVLDGAIAAMEPAQLAERFEGTFQDNPFTIVLEMPVSVVVEQSPRTAHMRTAFQVHVVENPIQRESAELDPLAIIHSIATGVIGQPGGAGSGNIAAEQQFYRYMGDARGFIFHRFTFTVLTSVSGAGLPARPSPIAT